MEAVINNNSRVLGIDYGKRYVGVAISDPLSITAQGLCTIYRKRADKQRQTLSSLSSICEEYSVSSIVIGLPKNLDGSENERCEHTYDFAALLHKKTGLPIYLWDERLTTVAGDREMDFLGIKNKDKKSHSDELAAMMILQGFMDSNAMGVAKTPYLG